MTTIDSLDTLPLSQKMEIWQKLFASVMTDKDNPDGPPPASASPRPASASAGSTTSTQGRRPATPPTSRAATSWRWATSLRSWQSWPSSPTAGRPGTPASTTAGKSPLKCRSPASTTPSKATQTASAATRTSPRTHGSPWSETIAKSNNTQDPNPNPRKR